MIRTSVAFAMGLLFLPADLSLRSPAQAAPQAHTRLDDCNVMGVVARNLWHGTQSPMPMAAASFAALCDWKGLGLVKPALVPASEHPPLSFGFSQPVYSADGRTATLTYAYGTCTAAGCSANASDCTAARHGEAWVFVACKRKIIT